MATVYKMRLLFVRVRVCITHGRAKQRKLYNYYTYFDDRVPIASGGSNSRVKVTTDGQGEGYMTVHHRMTAS